MRIQRRLVSLVAGLVSMAVISACGTSSTSSVLSGKTPSQILAQALSKANGQKFSFSSVTSFSADLSNVTGFSESQLGAFGPALANGFTVKIDGTYESATRTTVHISVTAPICSGDFYETDYDGSVYLSVDGNSWADGGPSSSSPGSITNQGPLANNLTGLGFKDNGSTSQDGQNVEDLRLDFNNQLIQKIATAAGQGSAGAAISQFVNVTGDGVDIYVLPSDGFLESVNATLNVTLDVGSIVRLISLASAGGSASLGDLGNAGGKLGVSLGENVLFTDWGSATVTKPSLTANATVPNLCPELGNLGALDGLFGNLSTSTPTPDLSGNGTNSFSSISNGLNTN